MTDTTKEVIGLIEGIKTECKVDEDTDLFESGVVDSFIIFNKLLPLIEEKYGIEISPLDLMPENFMTPRDMADFIDRKRANN